VPNNKKTALSGGFLFEQADNIRSVENRYASFPPYDGSASDNLWGRVYPGRRKQDQTPRCGGDRIRR
jgi:hypothetical protein